MDTVTKVAVPITCVLLGLHATHDKTDKLVMSAIVCAQLEPYSTVVVEAWYPVGKVLDLCKGESGFVDWDQCKFTYVEGER